MPYGEDGTGDASGGSEIHEGQGGGKTGILHADFDGHGTNLRLVHAEFLCAEEAQCHTAQIMEHDNGKDDKAVVQNGAAREGHYAAYGEDDDQSGKHGHNLCHAGNLPGKEIIASYTCKQGKEHHFNDGQHHGGKADIHPGTGDEPDEEGSDKGGQDGIHHGHGNRKGHICMGNVGNNIGSGAAGAAAHQHHADGNGRGKGEEPDEHEGQGRHNDELEKTSQSHVLRLAEHIAEIRGLEAHAHAEHNDSQHEGNPGSQRLHDGRKENTEQAGQYDAYSHVAGTDTDDFIKHGKLLDGNIPSGSRPSRNFPEGMENSRKEISRFPFLFLLLLSSRDGSFHPPSLLSAQRSGLLFHASGHRQ